MHTLGIVLYSLYPSNGNRRVYVCVCYNHSQSIHTSVIVQLTFNGILHLLNVVHPLEHQSIARSSKEECSLESPETKYVLKFFVFQAHLKINAFANVNDFPRRLGGLQSFL